MMRSSREQGTGAAGGRSGRLVASLAVLTTLVLGSWSAAAAGADFTFNVPVDLQTLHSDVTAVRVLCGVMDYPAQRVANQGDSTIVTVADGEVTDTIVVTVNVDDRYDKLLYSHWYCKLLITSDESPWEGGHWHIPVAADVYNPAADDPWKQVRPGAVVDTGFQLLPNP